MQPAGKIATTMLYGWFTLVSILFAYTAPAMAAGTVEDYLKCPMSDQITNKDAAIAWWNRRSDTEQRLVLALPCIERFVPIVCIFLYDPNLVQCTNNGVAEYRANKACQEKGLDLLSQEMADCKATFKKTFKLPFGTTS